jgi:hypothetical protein
MLFRMGVGATAKALVTEIALPATRTLYFQTANLHPRSVPLEFPVHCSSRLKMRTVITEFPGTWDRSADLELSQVPTDRIASRHQGGNANS